MKMQYESKAYAKLNLSLDIISKMEDGYHFLKTVMQTVELCDDISISCETGGEGNIITVETGLEYIPNDSRNIAAIAAETFFSYTGITGYNVHIDINKTIPVCAGLGGGSADAACVLRMLDDMLETKLSRDALEKLGYSVGADVPFCITGGTKLATGRGEILTDLPKMPQCFVVICKPPFSCSTPELFKRVNLKKIKTRPDNDGLVRALENNDLNGIAKRMYNVFEDVVMQKSEIDDIKGVLLDSGALGAVMTGSGPTVFGVFDEHGKATGAQEKLKKIYKDCFLTQTI